MWDPTLKVSFPKKTYDFQIKFSFQLIVLDFVILLTCVTSKLRIYFSIDYFELVNHEDV